MDNELKALGFILNDPLLKAVAELATLRERVQLYRNHIIGNGEVPEILQTAVDNAADTVISLKLKR